MWPNSTQAERTRRRWRRSQNVEEDTKRGGGWRGVWTQKVKCGRCDITALSSSTGVTFAFHASSRVYACTKSCPRRTLSTTPVRSGITLTAHILVQSVDLDDRSCPNRRDGGIFPDHIVPYSMVQDMACPRQGHLRKETEIVVR